MSSKDYLIVFGIGVLAALAVSYADNHFHIPFISKKLTSPGGAASGGDA
jgi:hypothetical protein